MLEQVFRGTKKPPSAGGQSFFGVRPIDLMCWAGTVAMPLELPGPGKDAHLPIHSLEPRHDPQTLEWATELLVRNIGTHRTNTEDDAKCCWPEVDNCEGIWAQKLRRSICGFNALRCMMKNRTKKSLTS